MMNVETKVIEGEFCLDQVILKRATKEENINKSETWLPWVAAQKNGNNVCDMLAGEQSKSIPFFVTGSCVTHRRLTSYS